MGLLFLLLFLSLGAVTVRARRVVMELLFLLRFLWLEAVRVRARACGASPIRPRWSGR